MTMAQYTQLQTLLNKNKVAKDTTIKWEYYGYGFLSCSGECKVSELPSQVKYAKCFEVSDGVYRVDGAL